MALNIAECLEEAAAISPDRVAVYFEDQTYTYAQMLAAAQRAGGMLRDCGAGPGTRVALMLPNVPQFAEAFYGTLYTGATAVPFNVMLRAPEIAFELRDCGAKVLVVHEVFAEEAAKAVRNDAIELIVVETAPVPNTPAHGSSWLGRLAAAQPMAEPHPTRPDDTAVMLYTTATSGYPLGAELTHFNLHQQSQTITHYVFAYSPDDVFLTALPLFHSFGLTTMLHAPFQTRSAIVMVPRFDAGSVLAGIARYGITLAAMVPTMFHLLTHYRPDTAFDVGSVREFITGGAAMPRDLVATFHDRFGMTILEGYGLTETSPLVAFNRSQGINRPGSVGLPIWGCKVRSDAGPGAEGEIMVRGHNVMKGYFQRPRETAEALQDGWLRTGDLGRLDEDGYLWLTGLKKDMYIRGGLNVYPAEVERVLREHPSVAEAAVLGMPDPLRGAEGCAVLVAKPGEEVDAKALSSWCRTQLASYKAPRRIETRDSLPRNTAGAVDKAQLRAELSEAAATRTA